MHIVIRSDCRERQEADPELAVGVLRLNLHRAKLFPESQILVGGGGDDAGYLATQLPAVGSCGLCGEHRA